MFNCTFQLWECGTWKNVGKLQKNSAKNVEMDDGERERKKQTERRCARTKEPRRVWAIFVDTKINTRKHEWRKGNNFIVCFAIGFPCLTASSFMADFTLLAVLLFFRCYPVRSFGCVRCAFCIVLLPWCGLPFKQTSSRCVRAGIVCAFSFVLVGGGGFFCFQIWIEANQT